MSSLSIVDHLYKYEKAEYQTLLRTEQLNIKSNQIKSNTKSMVLPISFDQDRTYFYLSLQFPYFPYGPVYQEYGFRKLLHLSYNLLHFYFSIVFVLVMLWVKPFFTFFAFSRVYFYYQAPQFVRKYFCYTGAFNLFDFLKVRDSS